MSPVQLSNDSDITEFANESDENRAPLLREIKAILQLLRIQDRKRGCPGFKLVQAFDNQEGADPSIGFYNTGTRKYMAPLANVDYDPTKNCHLRASATIIHAFGVGV